MAGGTIPGCLWGKRKNHADMGSLSEKKSECPLLTHVQLFLTPWTIAHQAPLSRGFSRQEYWSGLLFPSPGDLPDPGIKPGSPILQADSSPSEPSRWTSRLSWYKDVAKKLLLLSSKSQFHFTLQPRMIQKVKWL